MTEHVQSMETAPMSLGPTLNRIQALAPFNLLELRETETTSISEVSIPLSLLVRTSFIPLPTGFCRGV